MKNNLKDIKLKKKHKVTPSSSNPSTPNTTACGVMGKKLKHTEKQHSFCARDPAQTNKREMPIVGSAKIEMVFAREIALCNYRKKRRHFFAAVLQF